jgi:hypothetical protein
MVAVSCTQVLLVAQTFGRIVVVVPVVLSLSVAVAQSYVTVSGQVILYQNVSWLLPAGAVNVWVILESPFVGLVLPRRAAYVPL